MACNAEASIGRRLAALTCTICMSPASCTTTSSASTTSASRRATWPRRQPDQRLVVAAVHVTGTPSRLHHLHHAAAGRDGDERVRSRAFRNVSRYVFGCGSPTSTVSMRSAMPAAASAFAESGSRSSSAPSRATRRRGPCRSPGSRASSAASRRGRTRRARPDLAVHQVARQPPDAQRRGAVRTRRPAHHRADHVVEDGDSVHGVLAILHSTHRRITPSPASRRWPR